MVDIRSKIKIDFKPANFEKQMLGEIAFNINQNILQNKSKIKKEIKLFIYDAIINEITAKGLQDGNKLAFDLGIPIGTGEGRVRRIAATVSNSAYIGFPKVKRVGKTIRGGIKIGIILDSYEDVLALSDGIVRYEQTSTGDEIELPWLGWLLKEGGKILIPTHYVKYVNGGQASRSKGAIMVKTTTGVGWRVQPLYEGTENDNWFTRAFEGSNEAAFLAMMNGIIIKYIDKTAVVN